MAKAADLIVITVQLTLMTTRVPLVPSHKQRDGMIKLETVGVGERASALGEDKKDTEIHVF